MLQTSPSVATNVFVRAVAIYLFGLLFFFLMCGMTQAQTSLSVGEISFLAAESDGNGAIADGVTIVPWVTLAPGTVLKFTDNGLENAAGTSINNTEHVWTFTVGASAINAGTVLKFSYDSPTTGKWNGPASGTVSANLGGTGATINSGISTSGDQFFVYQGTGAGANIGTGDPGAFSGSLVAGINIGNLVSTGTADSNSTYAPTTLTNSFAWVNGGNIDNAYYAGARTGLTNTLYRSATNSVTNFTLTNTVNASYDHSTTFTIANAAAIHWDANGATAGNGGTGTWDAATADRFKNGATGTTFLRWVNSSTGNDHTAVFGGTAGTVSVATGGVTTSGIQFDTTGYTIQSNTITLSGTTVPIISVGSGSTATINSTLAGTAGFEKTGDGVLVLGGSQDGLTNSTLTVSAGTLRAGATDQSFIPGTGTLHIASGATVDLNGWGEGMNGLTGTGTITTSATTTNVRLGVGDGNASTTFGGVIENGSGSIYLQKNGTGTLTLTNAASTFSGTSVLGDRALASSIQLNAGKLAFTSNGALGSAGGDFYLDGGDAAADGLVFDADGITLDAGRTLNINQFVSIEVGSGRTGTIAGAIWGDDTNGSLIGGNDSFTKTGAGTLALTGSTDQLDEIFINAGTLRTETALSTARVTVSGGAVLQFGHSNATGDITGTSATVVNEGTVRFQRTGAVEFDHVISGSGSVEHAGGGTTTLSAANTYSGGTTITAGSVAVKNTTGSATGSGNVAVTGSTILGTGRVSPAPNGSVILGGAAIVSVGDAGDTSGKTLIFTPASGTMSTTFQSGSVLEVDLFTGAGAGDNSGIGTSADALQWGGTLALQSNVKLRVNNPNGMTTFAEGDSWKVLDWTTFGGSAPTGTFEASMLELPTLTGLLGWDTSMLYTAGTIGIIQVPEPSRAVLVLLGVAGLMARRRRK